MCTIAAHNIAQNRPGNIPCYPPGNHHCSDDVYLRGGGAVSTEDWHLMEGARIVMLKGASSFLKSVKAKFHYAS